MNYVFLPFDMDVLNINLSSFLTHYKQILFSIVSQIQMFKALFLISLILIGTLAEQGVDLSNYQGAPSQEVFNCFKNNGKDFAIIQIWEGGYGINQNFVGNWQKAKAAGITYVDAYAFFCNNCNGNTPANICTSIKNTLPSGFDGMVWLDIEDCNGCWTGAAATRMIFAQAVAATCTALGLRLGVYSGNGSWGQVFGSASYDGGALKLLPLWYAHYDSNPSFSDWNNIKFGGWSSPNIKQYQGSTSFCGTTVDFDAY